LSVIKCCYSSERAQEQLRWHVSLSTLSGDGHLMTDSPQASHAVVFHIRVAMRVGDLLFALNTRQCGSPTLIAPVHFSLFIRCQKKAQPVALGPVARHASL
jgi:hypothetical protein